MVKNDHFCKIKAITFDFGHITPIAPHNQLWGTHPTRWAQIMVNLGIKMPLFYNIHKYLNYPYIWGYVGDMTPLKGG